MGRVGCWDGVTRRSFGFDGSFVDGVIGVTLRRGCGVVGSRNIGIFLSIMGRTCGSVPDYNVGTVDRRRRVTEAVPFRLLRRGRRCRMLRMLGRCRGTVRSWSVTFFDSGYPFD